MGQKPGMSKGTKNRDSGSRFLKIFRRDKG